MNSAAVSSDDFLGKALPSKSPLCLYLFIADTYMHQFTLMDKQSSPERSAKDKNDLSSMELQLLPPGVLQDILSRLSIKEILRMTVLSREWRRKGICHPDLVFTEGTFFCSNTTMNTHRASRNAEFITEVDNVLRPLWSTPTTTTTMLDKFVVRFSLGRKYKNHIDRWISFSTASKAKHIALDLRPEPAWFAPGYGKYIVPLCNLSGPNCSCVKSLDLGYVCLKLPRSFNGITNLKKLTLHMVSISVNDLRCLLLSCALLESLNIESLLSPRRSSLESLCIRQELRRLQYLLMHRCDLHMIDLNAPNLIKFEFDDYMNKVVLRGSLKLSEATFASYRRYLTVVHDALDCVLNELPTALVQRLFLQLALETSVRSSSKTQTSFINLTYLNINLHISGYPPDISWVMGFVNLLELSPFLEELELHMHPHGYIQTDPRIMAAVQGRPLRHLRSVYMTGFCSLLGVAELALYILGNATVLERMVVDSVVRMSYGHTTDQLYSVCRANEFVPPSPEDQEMFGMNRAREYAKEHLGREEFSRILTIL
ncbi:F-box/FBD/LRR-repeat protein At1g13570 isoform X1 [Brachypodium distachyon]|nr:F-box/FBD/LRR-repeat protein At1g13570 isoform X1 [Brachypodium distachyon]|eukprot:XP_024318516.1 F-box/FBD/LRR-repeat protein At1g13570 isoform X1 [Brachypodium distachyon]